MIDDSDGISQRLELAKRIAREAGQLTLRHFRSDTLQIDQKSDHTPVTNADREAEQRLRRGIEAAFADDGIIGEEFGEKPGTSDFCWILDPIDGTKSFVSGVPLYGTLVGVTCRDEPVIGVIEIPALAESIYAAVGRGAWYMTGDEPAVRASVSSVEPLSEGVFCTSEVASFHSSGRAEVFERLQNTARITRTWGDCYGYLLVATGRAELMVDPVMNIWDTVALKPVIEEAGGRFVDFKGVASVSSGEAVATNGKLLDEVLAIIADK